jgi:hypothetical protein
LVGADAVHIDTAEASVTLPIPARDSANEQRSRLGCGRTIWRDHPMPSRRAILQTLTIGLLSGLGIPAFGKSRRADAVRMFDTDNDGTLDLDEVKKAASALFDKLDRDHDGTLDQAELAGRLSARQFAAADPDHDGTLTKDEFLAVVEQRFNAANLDNDKTLDAKEFETRAGQALLRLLR